MNKRIQFTDSMRERAGLESCTHCGDDLGVHEWIEVDHPASGAIVHCDRCEHTEDSITEQATAIGAEHGKSAASWVFDGNTTDETYRRILKGIQEIDPEVMDSLRKPSLSGEFADDYSERDLSGELYGSPWPEDEDSEEFDEACNAYNDAASSSFWAEVERLAREHLTDSLSLIRDSMRLAAESDNGAGYTRLKSEAKEIQSLLNA